MRKGVEPKWFHTFFVFILSVTKYFCVHSIEGYPFPKCYFDILALC